MVSRFLAHAANIAIAWLVTAWLLMLAVGVVRAEWIPALPTIGFRLALLLSMLVTVRAIVAAFLGKIGKAINGDDR